MNQTYKIVLLTSLVIVTLLLALMPVKNTKENSKQIKATVTKVAEGGLGNIAITIEGSRGIYCIESSDKNNLSAESLSAKLLNKEVVILYTKPGIFASLNPMTNTITVNELKLGNEVIYSRGYVP